MKLTVLLICLLLCPPLLAGQSQGVEAPSFITLDAIPVCYDFGCKHRSTVSLSADEWQQISGWFHPAAASSEEERQQIKQAIGWMEVIIGRHTPTHKDIAFDLPISQQDTTGLFPGQQDCIDEAVNTTTYLRLLELEGQLTHHTVIEQAYRSAVLDQHWAGQIRELGTGKRYVVDSWFQPNGFLPIIQDSADWENISPLTAVVDNSSREQRY